MSTPSPLGAFLTSRPRRPNPARPRWAVSRVPADAPWGTPGVVLAAAAPSREDARAEVLLPTGGLRPLDVVALTAPLAAPLPPLWPGGSPRTTQAEHWFVRDDGRAAPLPRLADLFPDETGASAGLGALEGGETDWRHAWFTGRGDLLLRLAARAGVGVRAIAPVVAAGLRDALGLYADALPVGAVAELRAVLDGADAWAAGGGVSVSPALRATAAAWSQYPSRQGSQAELRLWTAASALALLLTNESGPRRYGERAHRALWSFSEALGRVQQGNVLTLFSEGVRARLPLSAVLVAVSDAGRG